MPKFVFAYHGGKAPESPEEGAKVMAEWNAWYGSMGEAVVDGVPVLSTRIDGVVGLLGEDYGGYFEVGDTDGLRELLLKFENDAAFRESLRNQAREAAVQFDPRHEEKAWRELLEEIDLGGE